MKVRIGNDICLNVTLLTNNGIDAVNIHSIKAYIINTTLYDSFVGEIKSELERQDEMKRKHEEEKSRTPQFVSRFPLEPHVHAEDYCPTEYDITCSGRPTYHVHPIWYVPAYSGFGIWPHSFEPHMWLKEPHTHFGYDCPYVMKHRHGVDFLPKGIDPQMDHCEFLAPVESTSDRNKINVYFPAENQIYTGTYKLVIVAKLYQSGYSLHNLKTVTMDYDNVFTLVDSS